MLLSPSIKSLCALQSDHTLQAAAAESLSVAAAAERRRLPGGSDQGVGGPRAADTLDVALKVKWSVKHLLCCYQTLARGSTN